MKWRDKDDLAAQIKKYGGIERGRKYPRLAEGEAHKLAEAAGVSDDSDVMDLAESADEAISEAILVRESDGDREEIASAREDRDGQIEEFIDALRAHLWPDLHAAEQAKYNAEIEVTDYSMPGLPG